MAACVYLSQKHRGGLTSLKRSRTPSVCLLWFFIDVIRGIKLTLFDRLDVLSGIISLRFHMKYVPESFTSNAYRREFFVYWASHHQRTALKSLMFLLNVLNISLFWNENRSNVCLNNFLSFILTSSFRYIFTKLYFMSVVSYVLLCAHVFFAVSVVSLLNVILKLPFKIEFKKIHVKVDL